MSHQNSGPRDYVHKNLHAEVVGGLRTQLSAEQCHVVHLKDQLTDAKRNEESVVAENGELKPLVLKLESELVGLRVDFSGLQHRAKRELATAVHEAGCNRVRLGAVRVRLNTLEAAVRAVRDGHSLDRGTALLKLYALVPDGSEGGDS